jgi:hypothetical protein
MKLPLSLGMFALAGFVALGAEAGQQSLAIEQGQKARPDPVSLPSPIVLAQAAAHGAGTTPQPDFILKECQETESTGDPSSAVHVVDPAFMLKNYLEWHDKTETLVVDLAAVKITLLQGANHGEITTEVDNTGRTSYGYDAVPNYVGKDQAVFIAEYEGKRYKIVVNLVVSLQIIENPLLAGQKPVCPQPTLIKVNGKPVSGSSSYDLNSIPVAFADLAGAALGQTDAAGITLNGAVDQSGER